MTTTASDGFVYIEQSTVGGLARPLTLRQQKTTGRNSTNRMPTTERQAIPAVPVHTVSLVRVRVILVVKHLFAS